MLMDRIILICTILITIIYLWATTQIPTLAIGDPLGPKAFPNLLGIAMLIAAGIFGLEMWKDRAKNASKEPEPIPFEKPVMVVLAGVTVLTIASVLCAASTEATRASSALVKSSSQCASGYASLSPSRTRMARRFKSGVTGLATGGLAFTERGDNFAFGPGGSGFGFFLLFATAAAGLGKIGARRR